MPRLLAIETSQFSHSVAIGTEDGIMYEMSTHEGLAVEKIALMVRAALESCHLKPDDLDGIAVSEGPGSFSSLRAGLSFAKALCLSLEKPLLMVPTLKSLAFGLKSERAYIYYISTIFARQGEIYGAVYDTDLHLLESPRVVYLNSEEWRDWIKRYGNGALIKSPEWNVDPDLGIQPERIHLPNFSAASIWKLGIEQFDAKNWADLDSAVPFYLKDPNITTPRLKIHNSLNY